MKLRLSGAVFLDIRGDFDSLTHGAILSALVGVGLGGRIKVLVVGCLKSRTSFISTEDGNTRLHKVFKGVPQGWVLSFSLFNLGIIGLTTRILRDILLPVYANCIPIWGSVITRV